MTQSINSNDSGFRSRQLERIKRTQARRKLLGQFKAKKQISNQNINEFNSHQKQQNQPKKYLKIEQLAELYKNEQYNQNNQDDEDDFDMFGQQQNKPQKTQQNKPKKQSKAIYEQTDDQGYYIVIEGSIIGNGKYKVLQKLGKGMFGSVVKGCKVDNQNQFFAIKIIRYNQLMQQSGQKEYQILSNIKKSDYIMKVYDYFFEKGHLCLVCQLMGEDLRSYVRKNQSLITLDQIKKYAISMFMSLHQLRKNKIIHADIKPDNFLFTQDHKKIKLCDFGTSYKVQQHSAEIQYLVARYYRAPQIMLGYQVNPQNRYHIDTWAVGCTLFQLFTGQFLFNGSTNSQMLKQIMETKGKFNIKILKNCHFGQKHFDQEFNFLSEVYDKVSKKNLIKKMQITITAQRQLLHRLRKHLKGGQDPKKVHNFKDFLERCLCLNPKDRLTPEEAFIHPFLNYQIKLN